MKSVMGRFLLVILFVPSIMLLPVMSIVLCVEWILSGECYIFEFYIDCIGKFYFGGDE